MNPSSEDRITQDKLLHTVNEMASILLASDTVGFNEAVFNCLGMLSKSVSVDRAYIWENHIKNDILYCTQVFEWSEGADPQQGNDLTVDVLFPGDWKEPLTNNRCVNGIVSTFPDYERGHLQAQGIISILVVPVFLQNKFWGFVGFDDCHKERVFSKTEESILRSASLLIATAMLRNQITQNLMQAREEALSSTKAKSNFLSNMSHEIRTPINAITGMTAVARQSIGNAVKVASCLDKIDAASHQLLGLINDVLDMSKIEAGKMELAAAPFNLREMMLNIKNIISVKTDEKKQTFSIASDPALPEFVTGDDVRLSQIIINLLSNAVKFTPSGGKIDLGIRPVGKENDIITLEIEVTDNGIGISPERQQKLFRAFEQADRNTSRNYGGTGLGLTISKNIAKLMGGELFVKSKEGEGSKFTARVNLKTASEDMLRPGQNEEEISATDFSKYTALLAEDIDINREIMLELLSPTGIKIECAKNGKEALEMFKENSARYGVILMDIQMPEMDGYEATRSIRAMHDDKAKTIPIIAMTANAYKEDVQNAIDSGMNAHLSKPVDINALIRVLKKHLNQ